MRLRGIQTSQPRPAPKSAGGDDQIPEWGTEEWYARLDETVTYEPLDLSFEDNLPEPELELQGINGAHALAGAPIRVSYVRPSPQLDAMGIPVREGDAAAFQVGALTARI